MLSYNITTLQATSKPKKTFVKETSNLQREIKMLKNVSVISAAILLCSFGTMSHAADAVSIAEKTFSTELCDVKDPSAVADIPAGVSGFTGYNSAEGDWLSEPATSSLSGKRVALTVMGLGQPYFLFV